MDMFSDESSSEPTIIQKLFGTNHTTCLECKCGESSCRDSETFMYNMIYPEAPVDSKSVFLLLYSDAPMMLCEQRTVELS